MSWDDEDEWDKPSAAKDDGIVLNDKWDGEDEDDDTLLGDDWDEEPKKDEEKKPAVAPVKKALTKRQLAKKKEEEERLAAIKRAETRQTRDPDWEAKQAAARKRAIEESNARLCDDLFGGEGVEVPEGGEFKNEQLESDNVDMIVDHDAINALKNLKIKPEEKLEDTPLKTMDDYKKFAVKVSEMANKAGNQKMVLQFMTTLITDCSKNMKLDDCNAVKKAITVVCTQKQKEESNKKKKGGAKKAQLTMSSSKSAFDEDGDYDDGMDDW